MRARVQVVYEDGSRKWHSMKDKVFEVVAFSATQGIVSGGAGGQGGAAGALGGRPDEPRRAPASAAKPKPAGRSRQGVKAAGGGGRHEDGPAVSVYFPDGGIVRHPSPIRAQPAL